MVSFQLLKSLIKLRVVVELVELDDDVGHERNHHCQRNQQEILGVTPQLSEDPVVLPPDGLELFLEEKERFKEKKKAKKKRRKADRRVDGLENKPNSNGAPIGEVVSPRPMMRLQESNLPRNSIHTQTVSKERRWEKTIERRRNL